MTLLDAIDPPTMHHPGGKGMTPLPPGMLGDACFHGARKEHRLWLSRRWDNPNDRRGGEHSMILIPFVLSIGMNPSTATHTMNDRTIARDISFADSWGFKMLFKCNMGSWRATYPKDLNKPGVVPCHSRNIETIRELAGNSHCGKIVICTGNLPKVLREPADMILEALERDGHELWCYGRNPSGDSKHPLYLSGSTELRVF